MAKGRAVYATLYQILRMDVWFAKTMEMVEKNARRYVMTAISSIKSLSASLRITSVYLRVELIGRYENSFLIAALHMICQSMVSTGNASRKNFLYWTTQVLHQR